MRLLSAALLAGALAVGTAPGRAQAQGTGSDAPPPPSLSATRLRLQLQVQAAGPEAGKYAMAGQGGCQNYGNDKEPNWVVGWSSADGSELFIYRFAGTGDGHTKQHLTLQGSAGRRFVSLAADVSKLTRAGKSLRFTIDGTDQGGRKLSGFVSCAAQTQ